MTPSTLEEQLIKYLTDAHSIERQALVQMRVAPRLAGDPRIAQAFSTHLEETQQHEQGVADLLEQHRASPSKLKDIAGTVSGAGFGVFAAAQPDTSGKLVAHAFSYEHMEEAAYRLLGSLAQRLGDEQAVAVLARIEQQERAMGDTLAGCFDAAVEAALGDVGAEDLQERLVKYVTDVHAIERQSLQLLDKGPKLAGVPALAELYAEHRRQSEEHLRLVEQQLDELAASPSKLKDAALRLGALNWGMFFQAQPDTPAKLAAFAYAFEHLEIASYELLQRVARRAGDSATEQLAARILAEEEDAADKLWGLLDEGLTASLQEQGIGAGQ